MWICWWKAIEFVRASIFTKMILVDRFPLVMQIMSQKLQENNIGVT